MQMPRQPVEVPSEQAVALGVEDRHRKAMDGLDVSTLALRLGVEEKGDLDIEASLDGDGFLWLCIRLPPSSVASVTLTSIILTALTMTPLTPIPLTLTPHALIPLQLNLSHHLSHPRCSC